jgi:hypothetical protein
MKTTRPLFQFDPGWLFVLAGLGVCAAGVLLPAQTDLEALQLQVAQLRSEEVQAYGRHRSVARARRRRCSERRRTGGLGW